MISRYTPVGNLQAILQLARLFQQNGVRLCNALYSDLGRHKLEVSLPEIGPVKPNVEEWRSSWDTTIYPTTKGVVLIIGCVYAELESTTIFTGYAAMEPPSCDYKCAIAAGSFAELLTDLLPKYLDILLDVLTGAAVKTTALLNLKWGHIFFTGSNRVGRIVAAAAV
ncbi:hypothetical protein B0H11DRAFT_2281392 [Mycena galericulata]|nr:hypothetical protein B0H11DRAFT_2281392 [Mycena galericulata]